MMALIVEMWLYLTIIGTITVPVVWTSICVNPFKREMIPNTLNGEIDLRNFNKIVEDVLTNKTISDNSFVRTMNDCNNNPACYIELKVYKESYLELCVTPRDTQRYKTCFKRSCSCNTSKSNDKLKTGDVVFKCSDEIYNYTSCEENNDLDNNTSKYHQGLSTSSDMSNSNGTRNEPNLLTTEGSKKGFLDGDSLWFTAGVFLGGIIFGTILSLFATHVCCRRKVMKLHRSTTTSTTEEIPLYNSYPKETAVYAEIPEQNQLCSSYTPPYYDKATNGALSPMNHDEYLEPLKRDGIAQNLQSVQTDSPCVSKARPPTAKSGKDEYSDQNTYCHVYNHLQTNWGYQGQSVSSHENYMSAQEMRGGTDGDQNLHMENTGVSPNNTGLGNVPESDVLRKENTGDKSGQYLLCIPHSLPVPDSPPVTDRPPVPDSPTVTDNPPVHDSPTVTDNSPVHDSPPVADNPPLLDSPPVAEGETVEETKDEVVTQNGGDYFVLEKTFST
ncbi:uncharacterized protein LOC125655229 isoform X3 [Ostrea edulis]|uniref:uncharacterized protein LOC125655229 isoform X3 n=1 Tax=Ostrea edulis TaxID=37623 RepID=UPI0024AF3F62|nr:uncharacterized protein LOC125655229 isoform X3 [Ostrea edulis]